MIIDKVNLAKLSDEKLLAIVAELTANADVKAQYDHQVQWMPYQTNARAAVKAAAQAITAWKVVNTVRESLEVSPETLVWTGWEAKAIHHVPTFSI